MVVALLPVVAGCYDREKCQPELWGPVSVWSFIALDTGVVMANRLFDGWQQVKGCCRADSPEFEYDGQDRPWLFVARSPASYGLRFSTTTTAACNPRWATVSIDGVPVATRVMRRTVFDRGCGSPHVECPDDKLYEEVDDVVWDWTPPQPGYSTVEFEWGGYKRTLRMLIAETETEPPVAEIPVRCGRVQHIDDETWLCDRVAYHRGVAMQSWPDTALVSSVGKATVVEWGGDRVRLWRFDGGVASVTADLDAGVSPYMRWDGGGIRYFDRDDIYELDDGRVMLDAERELLFLDDVAGPEPRLSSMEFGAQVVSVYGQPVSVLQIGEGLTNVCRGFDVSETGDCHSVLGAPVAGGRDGVWFINGYWWVASVGYADGRLFSSTLRMAENAYDATTAGVDLPRWARSLDGGERLLGHSRGIVGSTQQGGCLFYDVQLDGGLIPRVYPEVGELEPPIGHWGVPQISEGGSDGEWRWCNKFHWSRSTGVTYIYRAPRR